MVSVTLTLMVTEDLQAFPKGLPGFLKASVLVETVRVHIFNSSEDGRCLCHHLWVCIVFCFLIRFLNSPLESQLTECARVSTEASRASEVEVVSCSQEAQAISSVASNADVGDLTAKQYSGGVDRAAISPSVISPERGS